jgi:hypothetical protein
MVVTFTLSLKLVQAPLIFAIKDYLDSYIIEKDHINLPQDSLEKLKKVVNVYDIKERKIGIKPQNVITFWQVKFIIEKFIPMLSKLSFVTKEPEGFFELSIYCFFNT